MVDHGKSTKRKKHHDKDKYYNLAKEQGLRSRAAFKLSQINRQYPILEKATLVLDLCAAPGGWTQIAARVCGPKTQIIAVDILPIRNLHNRNIHTIVGDITTDKCKAEINRIIVQTSTSNSNNNNNNNKRQKANATNGGGVDVVLHDGAPNIGASYDKDAYEQIELAVHALRCATQHLKKHGSFVTKIYRSRDSASFQWVVQQLFKEVTVFKPKSSRQQSAEIFYVCQGYLQPDKIDPRLLDPKHIFEHVEGDTTGGAMSGVAGGTGSGASQFNVFHKSWNAAKRQRGGYDTEHLDATMRHIEPLANFVQAKGRLDAIQLLGKCTGFSFTCQGCSNDNKKEENDNDESSSSCHCNLYLHHPLTTPEIKECVVDLKLLNKSDFKSLMIWREKMLHVLEQLAAAEEEDDDDDSSDSDDEKEKVGKKKKKGDESEEEENEDEIQKEIRELRERKLREKKKAKKKERKLMSKKRRQAALGMDLNAIDVQEHDQFFSLATMKSTKDLNRVAEVNLDQVTKEEAFGAESDDDDDQELLGDLEGMPKIPNKDETESGYDYRRELELDSAYDRYLETTKNGEAKRGTKASKRSKKLMREKLAQESHEDAELVLNSAKGMDQDAKTYARMLQGGKDSDDDDSEEEEEGAADSDDGFDTEPMTPEEHSRQKKRKTSAVEGNPLIHKLPDDPSSVKTARWFSNPLFASIGQAADSATKSKEQDLKRKNDAMEDVSEDERGADDESSDSEDDSSDEEEEEAPKGRKKAAKKKKDKAAAGGLDADDVLAAMPKTDKQKRHEKRLKALARDERRQARKKKRLGDSEGEFDLVPANHEDGEDGDDIAGMEGLSEEKKQKLMEARKLIKAGMGITGKDNKDSNTGFEVVEAEQILPVMDSRKYDSENEDYDSDDYAKTMALGTMMLRNSKAKQLVDASYNRFAWNDPEDLPEWFVDDENRHYRPQLPIPPALLQKMKDKMLALSTKPIAKVAEARARKNRKAKLKLASAKKKAQAVANTSEMSETMKLKQISKAIRSEDAKKGKQYVVAKKGKKGVKGATMVDKRMKNDKRAMERSVKKRKGGKQGGLTGSKRRRNHK